jgi:hypothetical protein
MLSLAVVVATIGSFSACAGNIGGETESRRALELESAVRQGAGFYPRCYANQKEEKGMEATGERS